MAKDFIPGSDGDMLKWVDNFSQNIPTYAAVLGLSPEQVIQLQNNCTKIGDAIKDNTTAQAQAKQAVVNKLTIVKENTDSLRTGIGQFKKNNNYTKAIGEALKVIGTDDPIDPITYKPKISADVFPGHITVKFTKKGVQGVNIYSKLKSEENFVKLAFDSYSPYEDNRPLHVPGTPETRQYVAIGVVHDHEIGLMSDIIEVTFGG